jgi:hypothetical protein
MEELKMVVYKVITEWGWSSSPWSTTVKLVEENHDTLPSNIVDNVNGYYEEYYVSREDAIKTCLANQEQSIDRGAHFTAIGW